MFDVVAGTSIGAINAAFLLSHVTKRRREEKKNVRESWEGSAEKLEEFWKSRLASNINLSKWWPFSWDEKSWTSAWGILSIANSDIANRGSCKEILFCKRIYNKWSFKCIFASSTPKN